MSASIFLTTSDGQRVSMKVTPMMPLTSVLEHACQEFKLKDPHAFVLCKEHKVPLDLSLTIRFANIPNGSKLLVLPKSLAKSKSGKSYSDSSPVHVGLHLPEGGRVTGTFSLETFLWQILEHFESQSKGTLNLTKKTRPFQASSLLKPPNTDPEYLIPALLFMNREVNSLSDLQTNTLATLGVSKSVLFRLHFKPSGNNLAHFFPSPSSPSSPSSSSSTSLAPTSPSSTAPSLPLTSLPEALTSSIEPSPTTKIDSPLPSIPVNSFASSLPSEPHSIEMDRNFVLYAPPKEASNANLQLPDDFFELSPVELKLYSSWMTEKRLKLENQPLKTHAMREKEEALKRAKFPKTLIRIKFHDLYQLQFHMLSSEPVSQLYQLVASQFVSAPPTDFQIYQMVPRKHVLLPQGTLYDAGLPPASILYCNFSDCPTLSLLIPSLVTNLLDFPSSTVTPSPPSDLSTTVASATEPVAPSSSSPPPPSSSIKTDPSSSASSSSMSVTELGETEKKQKSLSSKLSKFIRLTK